MRSSALDMYNVDIQTHKVTGDVSYKFDKFVIDWGRGFQGSSYCFQISLLTFKVTGDTQEPPTGAHVIHRHQSKPNSSPLVALMTAIMKVLSFMLGVKHDNGDAESNSKSSSLALGNLCYH
jgi:hypothetical protein